MTREPMKAVAYLRTSSATNVGQDKDSDKRQRAAIAGFAKAAGYELVGEYYDAAVSGADPIDRRPGFMEMLRRVASDGAKTIIVESPDRFARDLFDGRLKGTRQRPVDDRDGDDHSDSEGYAQESK